MHALLKVLLKENFSLKRLLGFDPKQARVKAILIGLAIIYALVVFAGLLIWMFYDLAKVLNEMDSLGIMLNFIFFYATVMSVFMILFRVNGSLFYTKDYEMLAHLPLTAKTIFISKWLILNILVYLIIILFTLPMAVIYLIFANLSVLVFVYFVIGYLLLPLIPSVIFTLLALLLSQITSKLRRSQILNIIVLLILFFVFMGVMLYYSALEAGNPLLGQRLFMQRIETVYPILTWFIQAVEYGKIIPFLGFVAINLLVTYSFLMLMPKLAERTNQKGQKIHYKNHRVAVSSERSRIHSLVLKEAKKMLSSPIYALNAGIGPIFLIIVPIASIIFTNQVTMAIDELTAAAFDIEIGVLLFVGFSVGMSYSPSVSLSLEGKNFWLIKSLPIKAEEVMFSKILFNLILTLPFALIGILIFGFTLGINIINVITMLILVVVFAILNSTFYAMINLFLPKMNYINEVEVVKQSAAALVAVFGGFLIIILNGVILFVLTSTIDIWLIIIILTLFNSLLAALALLYVKRFSQKHFDQMNG
ncbi:hypothetical protein [Liberiplasma polymorphum]|uniref:hypothetical protein n=1 Tax=Liberiplasma polymorphum TaxID=3374570 RepID=UPI00377611AD